MPIIEIKLTNSKIRFIKYYFRKRYGSRKGLERLIKDALNEVISEDLNKELREAEKKL